MFNYGNANEAQKEAISATDGLVTQCGKDQVGIQY